MHYRATTDKPVPSKRAQQSIVRAIRHNALLSALIGSAGRSRARRIAPLFASWLPCSGCVLDIGTGTGHLTEALNGFARRIICSDVVDLSLVGKLDCLAEGTSLPFRHEAFDAVLLVTVLHHMQASAQAAVLQEALRVLRPQGRIILMEDTFHSALERRVTAFFDSVLSAEFFGHPHSNRTLEEWVVMLGVAGFHLLLRQERIYWYGCIPIRHSLMVAERPQGD